MPNITQITPPRVPLIDERTGLITREWYRYFYNLYYATGGDNAGAIPTDRGGTGTTQIPTNGQILVGNGSNGNYNATDLSVGPGIGATIGAGTLGIENTGVLSNIAGDGISVDQSTGDVTIENTGVLSITAGDGISVDQSTGNVTISLEYPPNQEIQFATAGQIIFNLIILTYAPGTQTLSVFVDGVNQIRNDAYIEASPTQVIFTEGLHLGAKVKFEI